MKKKIFTLITAVSFIVTSTAYAYTPQQLAGKYSTANFRLLKSSGTCKFTPSLGRTTLTLSSVGNEIIYEITVPRYGKEFYGLGSQISSEVIRLHDHDGEGDFGLLNAGPGAKTMKVTLYQGAGRSCKGTYEGVFRR